MILEKYNYEGYKEFSWLNFEYLPDSIGFKFEIYFEDSNNIVEDSIDYFYFLFSSYLSEIIISPFDFRNEWGNFCLDVWNEYSDTYDYTLNNKHETTISYLGMLEKNKIEPSYIGFCRCFDWDKFLKITLDCVIQHTALYSMLFYIPSKNIVFYFHHMGSIGVYYKELNNEVITIVEKINSRKSYVKNYNDERILNILDN